ncbi:MAG: hypothetical protein FWD34_05660 [Oscillospiraceae bacterium]|nr:hypothetical protein [Oscillospiraceae bacterium]
MNVDMRPITNHVGTPYKTGVVLDPLNLPSFWEALGIAVSGKTCEKSAVDYTTAPNTSLRWHMPPSEQNRLIHSMPGDQGDNWVKVVSEFGEAMKERIAGTFQIPVGKNELPALMKYIEEALANGEPLNSALQRQIDKYTNADGSMNRNGLDLFWIDPITGEVKHASSNHGITYYHTDFSDAVNRDCDAVWDLAYDLQQFLRYTFFRQEGDCPDEIAEILEEIKSRQGNKCTERFDYPDIVVGTDGGTAAAEDEEKEEHEKIELIDELIATIAEHQEQLSSNSKYKYYEVAS